MQKFKTGSPPLGALLQLEEGVEGEGWAMISSPKHPRSRSLSTGSIASAGGVASGSGVEEHQLLDISVAALLIEHNARPPKAPKPKKVRGEGQAG